MSRPPIDESQGTFAACQRLEGEIRTDLTELAKTGVVSRARRLSEATGQRFCDDREPQYFTGDLGARFVLVHLNPKLHDDGSRQAPGDVRSFEEHFEAHRHFGTRMYGPSSPRTHRSPFDHKQIRFLRPFGVIDFDDDAFANLERAIDQKLQLELIPYASPTFSSTGFTGGILRPHFERVMEVIAARSRDYVIFCGRVFEQLLPYDAITVEHAFRLPKKDGSLERQTSRFAALRLSTGGRAITAGLAHSWARQGIPMTAYARKIAELYPDGEGATVV